MPLFEYECRDCGHHFEFLTRADQSPACPTCASADLQKLLSVFAVNTTGASNGGAATRDAVGGCGMCGDPRGPGSCSVN